VPYVDVDIGIDVDVDVEAVEAARPPYEVRMKPCVPVPEEGCHV
jgi:hypothetical protein